MSIKKEKNLILFLKKMIFSRTIKYLYFNIILMNLEIKQGFSDYFYDEEETYEESIDKTTITEEAYEDEEPEGMEGIIEGIEDFFEEEMFSQNFLQMKKTAYND